MRLLIIVFFSFLLRWYPSFFFSNLRNRLHSIVVNFISSSFIHAHLEAQCLFFKYITQYVQSEVPYELDFHRSSQRFEASSCFSQCNGLKIFEQSSSFFRILEYLRNSNDIHLSSLFLPSWIKILEYSFLILLKYFQNSIYFFRHVSRLRNFFVDNFVHLFLSIPQRARIFLILSRNLSELFKSLKFLFS